MPHRPNLIPGFDKILHGGDYNPDQWLGTPEIINEDFRLMTLAGCNTFAVGIFAWTSYERTEGEYNFDWLDDIMERMASQDQKVILATPSGAKPAWMSKEYPEVRRVNSQGVRDPHQGRHNHCWTSPVFRERVAQINEKLAERYAGHPALGMWHISNEYSGDCYCDLCLGSWQHWLEERYGNIDALNQAWWTSFWSHTFTSFDEVDPRDRSLDGMNIDFRRFNTHQCKDFIHWELKALRKFDERTPATTNLMGTFSPFDYTSLVENLDLVSDDQYPGYDPEMPNIDDVVAGVSMKDDLHRCMKPDRPWMLMESCPGAPQWKEPVRLKRPGLHQAEMFQALGHGAEGICYFQWRKGRGAAEKLHGAVVDHEGSEHTRTFKEVSGLGQQLAKLQAIIGSKVEADIAILYDWEVRWAFEYTEGVRNTDGAYESVARDHYASFLRRGVSVDVVGSDRDFSQYKVVVAPQLWMLRPGVADRIKAYVAGGGHFVATHYFAGVDQNNRCFLGGWPGEGLMEVFGVWNEEADWLRKGSVQAVDIAPGEPGLQASYPVDRVCAILHARGAKVIGSYAKDFYAGSPALTGHQYGRGCAYYLGGCMGPTFLDDFYSELGKKRGVPSITGSKLPSGVVAQRRANANHEFVFLENFSAENRTIALASTAYVDLLSGAKPGGRLELPPWGSTALSRQRA